MSFLGPLRLQDRSWAIFYDGRTPFADILEEMPHYPLPAQQVRIVLSTWNMELLAAVPILAPALRVSSPAVWIRIAIRRPRSTPTSIPARAPIYATRTASMEATFSTDVAQRPILRQV